LRDSHQFTVFGNQFLLKQPDQAPCLDLGKEKTIAANYYKILEIPKTATSEQIREAYRRQSIQWHPDRNPGDQKAEEKFKCVAEAYRILIDESTRAAYDRSLREKKEASARAAEEPQQEYVDPKNETETFLMVAQVMIKLHEKGKSWSEVIGQLQEGGLSQDSVFSLLALCFQVFKISIPYEEMLDIAWKLHKEGTEWGTIADLIQQTGYSEKLAYKVLRDIAATERKHDRILSRGSMGISLLDALLRGLSNKQLRDGPYGSKRENYHPNNHYGTGTRSRYY
jgi:curved DNA-binding protein CbpA